MSKKIKVAVVVGTRPNFIKITQFEKHFREARLEFEYLLIHTGQHFDHQMSEVFFQKLALKKPDYNLNIQISDRETRLEKMTLELSRLFANELPSIVVVVGDVDSTLAGARAAKQNQIKLAHVESGLRSFDLEMPEEVNRIEVDRLSDYLFVTEKSGLENLKQEGRNEDEIFFVGNTMIDTLVTYQEDIRNSTILNKLGLYSKEYVLCTFHRPRNVDDSENLKKIIEILEELAFRNKIVLPLHPRTMEKFNVISQSDKLQMNLIVTPPLDYLDFQKLIECSQFVLTDSGGIQEETTFKKIPCITLRPNTERPSTIDSGANRLASLELNELKDVLISVKNFKGQSIKIPDLWDGKATKRIVEVIERIFSV